MDLVLPSRVFADMLSWVVRTIPSRPTVPVLAGVVLRAEEDALTIEATDLDRRLRTRTEAGVEVSSDGSVLVPGRLLAEVARVLPHGVLRLRATDSEVLLECDGLDFRFVRLPLADYPEGREQMQSVGVVGGAALSEALARVLPAAGRDEMIPVFTGVQWEPNGETLRLSTTDRYRMATTSLPWEGGGGWVPETFLVSARLLTDVARGAPPERYMINCSTGSDGRAESMGMQFLLGAEEREVRTRLLSGRLPDLGRHLRAEADLAFWVATDDLRAAIGRVLLTVEDRTPIQLDLDDGVLTLSGSRQGTASGRACVAVAALDGPSRQWGCNPGYLLDGLSGVRSNLVRIGVTDVNKTVIVHEADVAGGEPNGDHAHLLKTMRLPR